MTKRPLFKLILIFLFFSTAPSYSQSHNSYKGKPKYQIQVQRNKIFLGNIQIEMFPNIAPQHVRNFDSLVYLHFFDSTAFHRVIPGFMIQGGDPNSKHSPKSSWGMGDPLQYNIDAEFSAAKHLRGILSAARDADINSANSQFFICVAAASWLDGNYSIYAQVTSGMGLVDTIVMSPKDANDNPLQKIEMFISFIGSNDSIPAAPLLNTPLSGTAGVGINKQVKWFAVGDAVLYKLEVATDSAFTNIFKSIDVAITSDVVTGLPKGTNFFWRVRANNGGHYSPFSEIRSFLTAGPTGLEEINKYENRIGIFPNPSNAKFKFENLRKDEHIEIYDLKGALVYKAIPQINSIEIDMQSKPAAVYLYKVINGLKVIQEGKIILQ